MDPQVAVVRRAGRKWLLSVCVSQYADGGFAPLTGVVSDVMLVVLELALWGFQCSTLFDAEATAAAIRRKLAELAARVQPGDEVVLHFLGHGGRNEHQRSGSADDGGLLWVDTFLPHDASSSDGRRDVPLVELHRWAQYFWELGASVTYLADHCHATTAHPECAAAGKSAEAFGARPRLVTVWPKGVSAFAAPALDGIRVLLAGEWALEWRREGDGQRQPDRRGHFSSLLVEALRAARARLEEGESPLDVDWDALMADLQKKVEQSKMPKPSPILARVPRGHLLPPLDATTAPAIAATLADWSRRERGCTQPPPGAAVLDALQPGSPFERPALPQQPAPQAPADAETLAAAVPVEDAHELVLAYQHHSASPDLQVDCRQLTCAAALPRCDQAACAVLGLDAARVPVLREEDAPAEVVELMRVAGERSYALVDREACLQEVQRRDKIASDKARAQQAAEVAERRRLLREECERLKREEAGVGGLVEPAAESAPKRQRVV